MLVQVFILVLIEGERLQAAHTRTDVAAIEPPPTLLGHSNDGPLKTESSISEQEESKSPQFGNNLPPF